MVASLLAELLPVGTVVISALLVGWYGWRTISIGTNVATWLWAALAIMVVAVILIITDVINFEINFDQLEFIARKLITK